MMGALAAVAATGASADADAAGTIGATSSPATAWPGCRNLQFLAEHREAHWHFLDDAAARPARTAAATEPSAAGAAGAAAPEAGAAAGWDAAGAAILGAVGAAAAFGAVAAADAAAGAAAVPDKAR